MNELEEFEKNLQEEFSLYQELSSLSYEEREAIKNQDFELLNKILQKKQEIIRKIGVIEEKIKSLKQKYGEEEKIRAIGNKIFQIATNLLNYEKENQEILIKELEDFKEKCKKFQDVKKAKNIYKAESSEPKFIDKKK
jgi:hypothetical protein